VREFNRAKNKRRNNKSLRGKSIHAGFVKFGRASESGALQVKAT